MCAFSTRECLPLDVCQSLPSWTGSLSICSALCDLRCSAHQTERPCCPQVVRPSDDGADAPRSPPGAAAARLGIAALAASLALCQGQSCSAALLPAVRSCRCVMNINAPSLWCHSCAKLAKSRCIMRCGERDPACALVQRPQQMPPSCHWRRPATLQCSAASRGWRPRDRARVTRVRRRQKASGRPTSCRYGMRTGAGCAIICKLIFTLVCKEAPLCGCLSLFNLRETSSSCGASPHLCALKSVRNCISHQSCGVWFVRFSRAAVQQQLEQTGTLLGIAQYDLHSSLVAGHDV